jgi:hypothetical protein
MSLDPVTTFWSGAGLVAVVGIVASAVGALWSNAREKSRWLREKRLMAAADLAGIFEAGLDPSVTLDPVVVSKASAEVELFGPTWVFEAALRVMQSHGPAKRSVLASNEREEYQEALTAFFDAVAKEAGFKR